MLGLALIVAGFGHASPIGSHRLSNNGGEGGAIRLDHYRSWHKVNPQPLKLPSYLLFLCRNASPKEVALESRSPHNDRYFTVYVNAAGKRRMLAAAHDASRYPVGSIILKEKLTAEHNGRVELITGMLKRPRGFNNASGDWQYFVTDGAGKLQPTATDHCIACHAKVKETDFVYRTYVRTALSDRRTLIARKH